MALPGPCTSHWEAGCRYVILSYAPNTVTLACCRWHPASHSLLRRPHPAQRITLAPFRRLA